MNRRQIMGQMLAGAAFVASGANFGMRSAWAQGAATRLSIVKRTIEINGKAASVFGLLQADGTHGLRLDAHSEFNVDLTNEIGEPTLVHWHGLTPPWEMDGVPDNPSPMLGNMETRGYVFPAGTGGTHWMHAHTLQEQNLLAAPLIVRTADDEKADEQEVVVLLHDFSFTPAEELLAKLKGGSSSGGMAMDHSVMGEGGMKMQGMTNEAPNMDMMAGMAMDLNDIEYDAYLANDRTLADPEVIQVENGGIVRLRIINGATATAFTVDTGVLGGRLIAVDGQDIQPLDARLFPIAMGQRLDIRLRLPPEGGSWPILALREGGCQRTGIILKTAGADVSKLADTGETTGPVLNLNMESLLVADKPLAIRNPDREYMIMLFGNMSDYTWGMQGAENLISKPGERIEITMHNMSMMSHPMHLHGHHFQVVAINGRRFSGAVRDTVLMPPMSMVTIAFDGGGEGNWPLHCHHLYHMASGMMSFVKNKA